MKRSSDQLHRGPQSCVYNDKEIGIFCGNSQGKEIFLSWYDFTFSSFIRSSSLNEILFGYSTIVLI